jgi:hypothetical protein
MRGFLIRKIGLGFLAGLAASGAWAATASASLVGSCPSPVTAQPFLSSGDSSYYSLLPGETAASFNATGWQLNGGASVVKATLADGTSGYVLDLPPGASATSPATCAPSLLPLGRMMTRSTGAPSGDASMYVSLAGSSVLGTPLPIVGTGGWTLTAPTSILPAGLLPEPNIDFTIVSTAQVGDVQIYDLWVDPRML